MDKIKKIEDLKQGDEIQGKNGERLEIISNAGGLLFYYNTKSRTFETKNLTKNARAGDCVFLF